MIIPSQAVRIVIATKPVDFRKGHDGLAAVAQQQLSLDPHSGVIVVFRAKRGDRIKVLLWDGSGMVMCYQRLESGSFAWPKIQDGVMRLSKAQFEALFEGLDWRRVMAGGLQNRVRQNESAGQIRGGMPCKRVAILVGNAYVGFVPTKVRKVPQGFLNWFILSGIFGLFVLPFSRRFYAAFFGGRMPRVSRSFSSEKSYSPSMLM